MLHGRQYKTKAILKFESQYQVKTKKCGFFIMREKPFLCASPDAIIDKNHLVEVKCPFTGRNNIIKPGKLFPYFKYENG